MFFSNNWWKGWEEQPDRLITKLPMTLTKLPLCIFCLQLQSCVTSQTAYSIQLKGKKQSGYMTLLHLHFKQPMTLSQHYSSLEQKISSKTVAGKLTLHPSLSILDIMYINYNNFIVCALQPCSFTCEVAQCECSTFHCTVLY